MNTTTINLSRYASAFNTFAESTNLNIKFKKQKAWSVIDDQNFVNTFTIPASTLMRDLPGNSVIVWKITNDTMVFRFTGNAWHYVQYEFVPACSNRPNGCIYISGSGSDTRTHIRQVPHAVDITAPFIQELYNISL